DNYATIMERKQVALVNEIHGPVYIYGDKDMIAYIINNILHNAIKYSGKGSEIKVIITDDTKKSVIVVQDQGKGMTQQKVEQIMSKENWSGSKEGNDIGLGLLITRRLINYHEGAINIESEAGVGTTVTVTIPKK
ncbi:sensor histidine kinase, partial [Salinivirga cyanobacteriivorans]